MPRLLIIGCVAILLAALPSAVGALAQELKQPKGIVELFTSQGCSSCPKADQALETLIRDGDVVALAYHVDYWNYLGWADTFSTKENTERQYSYARMFGRSSVYTPQAVINGREHVNGGELRQIRNQIEILSTQGRGLSVDVSADIVQDEIRIRLGSGHGKANVMVAYFNDPQSVDIKEGENRGRRISYWHAVTDMETIGMWEGKASTLVLPASILHQKGTGGCAILLQRMKAADTPGAILGATVITPTLPQTANRK
jgi:hypothetical protein